MEKKTEERPDEIIRNEYKVNLGCMPMAVFLGIITVGVIAIIMMTSCSKIDESEREERIPLPQGQIDPPAPDWTPQPDVNYKTHK